MADTPTRLSFEETANLVANLCDSPDNLHRERIGSIEYVSGRIGSECIAVCVDIWTGEGLRF